MMMMTRCVHYSWFLFDFGILSLVNVKVGKKSSPFTFSQIFRAKVM